jgi:hypothetical protein
MMRLMLRCLRWKPLRCRSWLSRSVSKARCTIYVLILFEYGCHSRDWLARLLAGSSWGPAASRRYHYGATKSVSYFLFVISTVMM